MPRFFCALAIKRKIVTHDSIANHDQDGNLIKEANAYFDPKTKVYHIALDSVAEAYMYFAVHESVHDIAANNKHGYKALEKIVLDTLAAKGKNIDELIKIQSELVPGQLRAYYLEEVIANTVPGILTDPKTGSAFARQFVKADKQTRTVFEKLLDAIRQMLVKAYNVLKKNENWKQMKAIQGDIKAIANIRTVYLAALEGAVKQQGKGKGEVKYAPKVGYTEDGKPVYTSNFPEGSTRAQRQARILELVQDVWSKKPIKVEIERNGKKEVIKARFNPDIDMTGERPTDASKLAYGNRKGTNADRKTTEKLADDFPEIIGTSKYDYSLDETGKESAAHQGVRVWHYFAHEIAFLNEEGVLADYNVNVDVKETADGDFVYSLAARKVKGSERKVDPSLLTGDPRTLHASGNRIYPAIANLKVPQNDTIVNNSIRKDRKNDTKFSLKDTQPSDIQALEAENAQLKETVELLKAQFEITKGHQVSKANIEKYGMRLRATV